MLRPGQHDCQSFAGAVRVCLAGTGCDHIKTDKSRLRDLATEGAPGRLPGAHSGGVRVSLGGLAEMRRLSSFPGREIIPKSGDFAGKPVLRPRSTECDRSAARCLLWQLRDAKPDSAYPSEKTAVIEASNGQNSLSAAAPRMGHAAHGEGRRRRGLPCWSVHGGTSRRR